jgi:UDP-N-acetylmuramate dehydrogenase
MKIYRNKSLKSYNTFGLNYKVGTLIHVTSEEEAISFFNGKVSWQRPLLIIGGGSNLLFTSDFKGTILYPEITGINIEETSRDHIIISAGAGVNWDDLVEWTVERGFGGLENLSLIPGLVGATPVQNIGAYGAEVKDSILKVNTISIKDGTFKVFNNNECEFGYRNSIFKTRKKGKHLITRVYYRLTINPLLNLNYGSLQEEISKLGEASLKNVRQAVINIRSSKLPDPEITGNAGSFFKNPVISVCVAERLKQSFPMIPVYEDQAGSVKIAAGWLIDKCGWKGKKIGDAGVHDKQALVIVNYGKATGKEIYDLSEEIKKSVLEKFDIELEREVEVIGPI